MQPRIAIKQQTKDRQQLWRDKFRSRFHERIKQARQDRHEQRREEQSLGLMVQREWEAFKKENEEALRLEGIDFYTNLDKTIEESLELELSQSSKGANDPLYEEYLQLEEDDLVKNIELYEESLAQPQLPCLCRQATFQATKDWLTCPSCGLCVSYMTLSSIQAIRSNHLETCTGQIAFTMEPGSENTVLGICNTCDFWTVV